MKTRIQVPLLALLLTVGCGMHDGVAVEEDDTAALATALDTSEENFFTNFLSSAYVMKMVEGSGEGLAGDEDALYAQLYFFLENGFLEDKELLLVGEFPNARFMSLTSTDDHGYQNATLADHEFRTALAQGSNPFSEGETFLDDQLYVVTLRFGDVQRSADAASGCLLPGDMENTAARMNVLDVTAHHFPLEPENIPPDHDELLPMKGGWISLRRYLPGVDGGSIHLDNPLVFVRDAATGCALAVDDPSVRESLKAYIPEGETGPMRMGQVARHVSHEESLGTTITGIDYCNGVQWFRGSEYVLGDNPHADYLSAVLNPEFLSKPNRYLTLYAQVPETASGPCAQPGCVLNPQGTDMRYWSLSFMEAGGIRTLASVSDADLPLNGEREALIVVDIHDLGIPATLPENALFVAALDGLPGSIAMRNILTDGGFPFGTGAVPYHTTEHRPEGGLMGNHAPRAAMLTAAQIPFLSNDGCP